MTIVGLLSLSTGVVVAFQGADPLVRYGANVCVVDLVGISMPGRRPGHVAFCRLLKKKVSAGRRRIGLVILREVAGSPPGEAPPDAWILRLRAG